MVTISIMPASPTPSLETIAAAAGVSAMTVSRVLREAPNVSSETRNRVIAAAHSLKYKPDPNGTKIRFSGQSDFRSFSAGFCGEGYRLNDAALSGVDSFSGASS